MDVDVGTILGDGAGEGEGVEMGGFCGAHADNKKFTSIIIANNTREFKNFISMSPV
jgi:hypothetical protein